jgi:hypothetical protein
VITLLVLIYSAFLWLVFGQLKLLPLNKWTGLAALLAGLAAIGGILLAMNLYQPYTPDGRFYFYTTPIISEVKGRVEEVTVKANAPVKAGDVLFLLNNTGYRIRTVGRTCATGDDFHALNQRGRDGVDVHSAGAGRAHGTTAIHQYQIATGTQATQVNYRTTIAAGVVGLRAQTWGYLWQCVQVLLDGGVTAFQERALVNCQNRAFGDGVTTRNQ